MSSPPASGQPASFEGLFASRTPQQDVFTSPAPKSLFQNYPESPYSLLQQTPTDNRVKSRLGINAGFLVSPMERTGSSSQQLGGGASSSSRAQTPTSSAPAYLIHQSQETSVTIADPNQAPSWDNVDMGIGGNESDCLQFNEELAVYGSPYKAPMGAGTTVIPASMMGAARSVDGSQPPTPRSKKSRSVSGLGTPSGVQRSAKRIRQATYDSNSMPISPSANRRRVDHNNAGASSLTTSVPLSRAVSSSSFLSAPPFGQDRNVSSSSVLTAATWEHVLSPNVSFVQDYRMVSTTSIPDIPALDSSQPSPNHSNGRSPPSTPQMASRIVYYTSPTSEQNGFDQHTNVQGDMTLMDQVNNMMSVPGSASMASVTSFNSQSGAYRQSTLGTIMETPAQTDIGFSAQLPSHPVFQPMDYPAVPGMSLSYSGYPPMSSTMAQQGSGLDIQAWSNQTYNIQAQQAQQAQQLQPTYYLPNQAQQYRGVPQRNASTSFLNYQMSSTELPTFPGMPRSVSASYIQQSQPSMPIHMPPSMPILPSSMGVGGLFPTGLNDGLEFDGRVTNANTNDVVHWNTFPTTSEEPDTPRKRQTYPPVGKRLRPGPKPKLKTPKKGKGSMGGSSPMLSEHIDPHLLGRPPPIENDQGNRIQPLAGPSYSQMNLKSNATSPSNLVFGPDLAMVRSNSGNIYDNQPLSATSSTFASSSQTMHLSSSNQLGGPHTGGLDNFGQPTLSLQPARNAFQDSQAIAGLPRQFLETLYTCFFSTEGSLSGQPVKRFRCLIDGCERHFPRKSAIHSHIQTHLEDKPYVCTAEDCHAAFVRQHDLRRHTRIHSGTKPFPCPCGKGFARGDALMRHRQRGICSGSTVPRRDSP